eukprot:3025655-Prymnesium_polylepis.2
MSIPERQAVWLVSVCGGRPDYSVAGFGHHGGCHWCRARHPRAGGSSGQGGLHIGCIAYTAHRREPSGCIVLQGGLAMA